MKYLFGASGHAKVIMDIVNSSKQMVISGIFDDDELKTRFMDIPFLGKYDDRNPKLDSDEFLISIGDNMIRKKISKRIKNNFFTVIDESSYLSKSALIGAGTAVMPNAVINANTQIGKHCIINTSCVVEHDCVLKDFIHVSPGVIITGNVKIGEGTHIGAGAIVVPNLKIGKWSTIGAGAVILDDIPDYAVVVGNPGSIIKYNITN